MSQSYHESVTHDQIASWTTLPNELRIMIFKEVLNAVLDEQIAVVGSWTLENTSRWDVEKADAYHRTGKPTRACNKAMKSMCAMQPGNNAVLIKAVRDSKTELEAKMEQSANDRTFEDRLWSSFEELVDAWRNSNMKEMYQRVLNAMARKLEDLEEAAII